MENEWKKTYTLNWNNNSMEWNGNGIELELKKFRRKNRWDMWWKWKGNGMEI